MLPFSDDPGRFAIGVTLITDDGRELVVAASAPYRDRGLLVRFEGVSSRAEAESLRGSTLTVEASERRNLDLGEFWEEDLIGLIAVTPAGGALGTVTRLEYGPGQDRLVVTTHDGTEVLIPFVAAIVADPTDDGTIAIDAPEGLF